jgi:hypothetical protein
LYEETYSVSKQDVTQVVVRNDHLTVIRQMFFHCRCKKPRGGNNMRTISLAILAGVAVCALPVSVSAQQYTSPMPTIVLCPPNQVWNEDGGYCERTKRGPGPAGGPGSQPAGATSNDALRRMLILWR